jgi:hypothetical protein
MELDSVGAGFEGAAGEDRVAMAIEEEDLGHGAASRTEEDVLMSTHPLRGQDTAAAQRRNSKTDAGAYACSVCLELMLDPVVGEGLGVL